MSFIGQRTSANATATDEFTCSAVIGQIDAVLLP